MIDGIRPIAPSSVPAPTTARAPQPSPAPAPARSTSPESDFARIERANVAVESGGAFVPSRLATTAGAPASLGRAQLLVRLQVDELERLPDTTLRRLGLDRPLLASIEARGQAALDYYDFFVKGEVRPHLPLSREDRAEAMARVHAGDFSGLAARFGEGFERATGIPGAELEMLARTRQLHAARGRARVVGAARAASETDLAALRERLGPALERYLARGNVAENRNGWYTRAAMSQGDAWKRLETGLRNGGDEITSRRRHMRNFRAAEEVLARVGGADALSPAARTRLLGQLSRIAHASPQAFQSLFGASSEARSLADVRRRIDDLVATPEGPGASAQLGRAVRSFTRALEREGGLRG